MSAAAAPSGAFTRAYPAGAVAAVDRAVRRDPGARVLASYALADWLLYESPSLRGRVAFDGRWEVLSAEQMARALDYLYQGGPDWERLASGYSVFVLSPAREPALVSEYEHRAGMRTLYRDALVAVFSRRSPR